MAQCYVVAMNGAEGRPLLVQEVERLDDDNFMGRVLVTVLSCHFNKLPEVALLDIPPIQISRSTILHDFAVINLCEFAHGPERPARKCNGQLMYHSGVARVAAIQGNDFPLFRGAVGHDSFVMPRMTKLLFVINQLNSVVHARFSKTGSDFKTARISCSHDDMSAIVSMLDGVCQ